MRIGLDVSKALGRLDGIGRTARGLARALAAAPGDHEVVLYPLLEAASEHEIARAFADSPRLRPAPRRSPSAGEVDVFHATSYALPNGWHGPSVFTLHDLTFLTRPQDHTLDNRSHCLRGVAKALARGARLLAVSEHTRREAERLLAAPAERIDVVHSGIDAAFRPRPPAQAQATALRLGLTPPYVLAVGTIEPRKNLAGLVAAFAALPAELRGRYQLALVGAAGWGGVDPAGLAVNAGIADLFHQLGEVHDDDLPDLYAGAAAFAYPSLAEGFGLPPLEAMACGCPVVTSDRTAIPEAVGDAALLVDPTDPAAIAAGLAAVLGDPDRARALAAAGPARAARFTWERAAERTLAVYARAVADFRREAPLEETP